ncbi:hypothetical protein BDR07DRAFT_1499270 [Suillus spraguei]|nr:hypothetical protein BDR07DRAFT_1499270 [Suillus spraguei]
MQTAILRKSSFSSDSVRIKYLCFSLLANLLRQIINVIETSSGIAEERGMDVASKFWIAFEKMSGKQDIDMIERQSRNIEILILFASLFSIINATFIIAMQPDPADTTNDLLVQLIMMQNTWNGSLVAVSAPVGYSSSKIWMQALAYMSLIFSLLAAFGAVVGKQFLDYYETNTNSDRLEGRYQRRHRMFLELQKMRFEPIMQSFTTLVEISIFLFILSLAAAMWMQHRIISLLILVPIAYGSLLYMYFVCVSLRSPDAPFQTPISLLIRYFLYHDKDKDHQSHYDSTASAISWILKVSTNPDIFRLALDLMVTIPNLRKQSQLVLSPSFIKKLLDMFKASFDSTTSDTGHTVLLGRGLIYISWKIDGATENLNRLTQKWKHWSSWRRLYFPQALEHCNTSFCQMKETDSADEWEQLKQADNTRTALRMALGSGMDKFVNPDKHDEYVELVWHGQFGSELYQPDVDWLMDCARHFHDAKDFNAAGDALLLLSDLKNISQDSIVPFLNSSPRSYTLLHPALRTACRAVDINSPCDSSLAQAILTAISSPIRRGHYGGDLFANAIQLLELTDWSKIIPL